MSAAYKYLALLVFCIPTEATPENDADFSTHDVAAEPTPEQRAQRIMEGVRAGDAKGAAEFLASLQKPALAAIWKHIDHETRKAITEAKEAA
jgi:hypothetical protein